MMSALGVGIGVGLGLGLNRWGGGGGSGSAGNIDVGLNYSDCVEQELLKQVVDGKDSNVTFNQFPYFLSEQTRVLLISAAYVHLKQGDISKYTRNLTPASRTILLSGSAEPYLQMLAKALAHYFEAKLLLLDITDFSLKVQSRYGGGPDPIAISPSSSALERVTGLLGNLSILPSRESSKPSQSGSLWRQNSNVESKNSGLESIDSFHKLRRNSASAADLSKLAACQNPGPLRRTNSWTFNEKVLVQSLYKVIKKVSRTSPVVLYLRDVERLIFRTPRMYNLFCKMFEKLSGAVLVLASRMVDQSDTQDCRKIDEKLSLLFPYNIDIKPPEDNASLVNWKSQLEGDLKLIQFQDNRNHISEVLAENDLECDDLGSICFSDSVLLSSYIEEIVVSAISYHLMNTKNPEYRNGKLIISSKSLEHGLSVFKSGKAESKDARQVPNGDSSEEPQESASLKAEPNSEAAPVTMRKTEAEKIDSASVGDAPNKEGATKKEDNALKKEAEALKNEANAPKKETGTPDKSNAAPTPHKLEVAPDNEFEKRIRPEVIPAGEICVSFSDIGALDNVKEALQELVMLPLKRPDLFKGGLLKPCKGILLFGPPGTGKTMLAKALATEAGANFINVSMSTITSKWFGEDEKNVRALFSLAAKISPTVIFVDEVDSMLGQRTRAGEHEAMRKIKNEFMSHWDGLLSKNGEHVLVLAATNRPFDLDEAIIRRFERRIMVGLPNAENREKILRTILAKENIEEGFDFKHLATITEGFTGSDLKILCTTAAFRPVRELLQKEQEREKAKKKAVENRSESLNKADDASEPNDTEKKEEEKEEARKTVVIRPLSMEDMRAAKEQVSASFASEGAGMSELLQWNDLYGEGGSRKRQPLSYFM
ncbi:hypothetical protein SUGI_0778610 [Cryptomeria japonica]|nr:hypothetical protein SUGI_0778610 [Cryptomeria japonica]